ncbi:hypothetical protein F937_01782 [Acinetobacter calcoaceticus ANC 3680]|uniref:hypothetical protein n=1 Tax=Acinetobacter calcoaceticus TaxID=471 RepID=UPI0002CE477E|nr:hypothetical protein [Acinetobacter calcoaceticus]ENV92388.1 hypothetical protein F937_01782 [Acinetobacter calcoaceticus ANC 3680]
MTTFKEAQNEVVVVESVEGEYLTADEYYHARIQQLKDEEFRQMIEVAKITARQKHQSELQSVLVSFPRWWQK